MPRQTEPRPGEPIRLTGAGRYRVVLDIAPPGAKRKQLSRNFSSLKTARQFVNETRADLSRSTYIAPDRATVADVLDRWLAAREADSSLRRVTVEGYRAWLLPPRRYFEERTVAALRHSDVEAFKGWALREGSRDGQPLSARTVTGALGCLRRALDVAVRDGLIPANPATGVRRPAAKRTTDLWTPDDLRAFRDAADHDELAVALRLVLCGLRRSEVLGLRWMDVDGDVVHVRQGRVALSNGSTSVGEPKSVASARRVAVEAIQPGTSARLEAQRGEDAALVVVDAVGQPLRPEVLSDRFRRVATAAGLRPIRMHAVRHSIATILAADPTVPDVDAAALLGHDVATFHATYARRTDAGSARAAAVAGAAIARHPPVTSV